jgi:hypothetical protein
VVIDDSTQVVDISLKMAKSCVATGWFSAPCGGNRRFSTHLSPLSRLIYRGLRRFRLIFFQAALMVGTLAAVSAGKRVLEGQIRRIKTLSAAFRRLIFF